MTTHRCVICRVAIPDGARYCDYHRSLKAGQALVDLVWVEGKNCEGREEVFSGRRRVTDEQAKRLCTGCPALGKECAVFKELSGPDWTWGVLNGETRYID